MAHLITIGNFRGTRIPNPLIEQAHLEEKKLDLQLVNQGILVTSRKKPRDGWKKAIEIRLAGKEIEQTDNECAVLFILLRII